MYGVIRVILEAVSKKKIARGSPNFSRVLVAPIPTRMIDIQFIHLSSCEWIYMKSQRVIGEDKRGGLGGF